MRNLEPLSTDPLDEFDLIIERKQDPDHAALVMLRPLIVKRYDFLKKAFDKNSLKHLGVLCHMPQTEKILQNCYSNTTNALDILIKAIKENQPNHLRSVCQYCGIDTDNTVDHYLPQSLYPEYSINHLNLFPCCAVCNPVKNNYWFDFETGYSGIMNLYLDRWPSQQFLFAEINYIGRDMVANFRMENPHGIDANLFQVIENHFIRIKLLAKYNNKIGNIYERICNSYSLHSIFKNNPNAIKTHLLQDAENHFASFGRNHYEGILKEALANNDNFLNIF